MMKNILPIILSISILAFSSCRVETENVGDFKLLPQPQEFEINGSSKLLTGDIQTYFLNDIDQLPVVGKDLRHIAAVEKKSDAQIVCTIDEVLNTNAEGYILKISRNKIIITGKDKAGLFYGLRSLEQLMIDAREQEVNLPICIIKDYPCPCLSCYPT